MISPLCKSIMEGKYNRLGPKGKYVISVVNFLIGLSAEKFLLLKDLT